ncbi:N-acetylglucosamine-6-phosphate deacetylase [Paenibacillus koleovorans]|uniref:N-acetylglucosamine-6-phosphate deacetylase n=1 Tax=Paenibacillus koleovorans TaxID=121608 RepID=UPI000FD92F4D|nr:amidohydrolase family protein [Paenibacillus koleovorans]
MSTSERITIKGRHYETGEPVRLQLESGRIAKIEAGADIDEGMGSSADVAALTARSPLPFLGPGLVDLQINGYGGIDLNTLPLEREQVSRLVRLVAAEGVTSFYPTIITNSDAHTTALLRTLAAVCEADPLATACMPGFHLEGPYISPQDGPRGAHRADYVCPPDWEQLERWQEAAGGRIRLLTLSPEWDGAEPFIRRCVSAGIRVAIGHTAATSEQIRRAVHAGATLSTHLGNAAHLTLPRHPNYIWDQLAEDGLWASLIADGFHLPEAFLKVALRIKGPRAFLVSDAAHLAGMPPGRYLTHIGGEVVLQPSGKLHMAENERYLAGSAQMLPAGIAHLARSGLCPLAEAWNRASCYPAEFAGISGLSAGLSVGVPADLTLFHWDGRSISIKTVYKNGQLLYESAPGKETNP